MIESTCATCKWWGGAKDHRTFADTKIRPDGSVGDVVFAPCRIGNPKDRGWFSTAPFDWCGEHTPTPKEQT